MSDKVKPITLSETGINQFDGSPLVPNQNICITKIEFKNNSRFETTMITSLDADGEEREYYTTSKVVKQISQEILDKYGDVRGFSILLSHALSLRREVRTNSFTLLLPN